MDSMKWIHSQSKTFYIWNHLNMLKKEAILGIIILLQCSKLYCQHSGLLMHRGWFHNQLGAQIWSLFQPIFLTQTVQRLLIWKLMPHWPNRLTSMAKHQNREKYPHSHTHTHTHTHKSCCYLFTFSFLSQGYAQPQWQDIFFPSKTTSNPETKRRKNHHHSPYLASPPSLSPRRRIVLRQTSN